MLFLTRLFGVTGSAADRDPAREPADIEEITRLSLLMQANAAAKQQRPLARGTHAKGVAALAQFEVFDVTAGRTPELAARLAQGIFAKPGIYPATVRFGNSDSKKNSDFKPDVRSLSFSVDLNTNGASAKRQDFSMQNTKTLPINDSPAFVAIARLISSSSPGTALWSLPFKDKLRVLRTLALLQSQLHQTIIPYQLMRFESNVPFRHGPVDIVKYSATPSPLNPSSPLQKSNPNGLQDELVRHVRQDDRMSSFDFGVQLLDPAKMTYWSKHYDASFWIENASIEWKESEAPFHNIARLTLLKGTHLDPEETKAVYFDVTDNSSPDTTPVGSINRARCAAELASKKTRLAATEQA
jgi:hypothetical protein